MQAEYFCWRTLWEEAFDGDSGAQYALALLYFDGDGVLKNKVRAAGLFRKAADQGLAKAQFRLGVMLFNGDGIAQDRSKAAELFRDASRAGHAEARYNLGVMHLTGAGVSEDKVRAASLFFQAAEQGVAHAELNLAWMCYHGDGVDQCIFRAAELFEKAALQGVVEAQVNLGVMCFHGVGVYHVDKEKAAIFLRMAAEKGDAEAMFNLGVMHLDGVSVPVNKVMASEFFCSAAEQGHVDALFNLGAMYYAGVGVRTDKPRAAELLERAAEEGDPESQFMLGVMLVFGAGVEVDADRAEELMDDATSGDWLYGRKTSEANELMAEIFSAGVSNPSFVEGILKRGSLCEGAMAKELCHQARRPNFEAHLPSLLAGVTTGHSNLVCDGDGEDPPGKPEMQRKNNFMGSRSGLVGPKPGGNAKPTEFCDEAVCGADLPDPGSSLSSSVSASSMAAGSGVSLEPDDVFSGALYEDHVYAQDGFADRPRVQYCNVPRSPGGIQAPWPIVIKDNTKNGVAASPPRKESPLVDSALREPGRGAEFSTGVCNFLDPQKPSSYGGCPADPTLLLLPIRRREEMSEHSWTESL